MQWITPTSNIVPDFLHTVHHGMLKNLMNWVTSFLNHHSRIDKINQLWAMMPSYPGFAQFNKSYCQVMRWRVMGMKALEYVIVPLFTATHLNPLASRSIPFTDALKKNHILDNQEERESDPTWKNLFLRLQSIVTLKKTHCRLSQKLHNIVSTNQISTLWSCICRTTSLTISASFATS